MSTTTQRLVGVAVLAVTGVFSLPVTAYVLDGPSTENWIIPVQLAAMAAVGAGSALLLPALASSGGRPRPTRARRGRLGPVRGPPRRPRLLVPAQRAAGGVS